MYSSIIVNILTDESNDNCLWSQRMIFSKSSFKSFILRFSLQAGCRMNAFHSGDSDDLMSIPIMTSTVVVFFEFMLLAYYKKEGLLNHKAEISHIQC